MDAIERYLDRVGAHLDVPAADKDVILAELRSHLHDKARDVQRAQPERPPADIRREVAADLGDPAALALAYGPGGRVELRDAQGRTLLRFSAAVRRAGRSVGRTSVAVGRQTGRAVGTLLVVLLIVFGVAVASATVLTIVLFDDVTSLVQGYNSETIHSSSDDCDPRACNTTVPLVRSFYVHADAKEVRFALDVHPSDGANGTFEVTVRDPHGTVLLARTWESGRDADMHDHETWPPVSGVWQVEYRFTSFTGHVRLHVATLGLPG